MDYGSKPVGFSLVSVWLRFIIIGFGLVMVRKTWLRLGHGFEAMVMVWSRFPFSVTGSDLNQTMLIPGFGAFEKL